MTIAGLSGQMITSTNIAGSQSAFTYNTLPTLQQMANFPAGGAYAYTSDQGLFVWNGTAWNPSTTGSSAQKLSTFMSLLGTRTVKVGWSGDSTTWQMSNLSGAGIMYSTLNTGQVAGYPTPSLLAPGLTSTLHVNRGANGVSLAYFLGTTTLNSLTQQTYQAPDTTLSNYGVAGYYDVSLARLIKENYDLVVLSWGINDTRGATAFPGGYDFRGVAYGVGNSALCGQYIANQLVTVINALKAGNPAINIIARMPNPGVTGGTGFVNGVTATDARNVLAYAYRYLGTLNIPNVLVWDCSASIFPNAAVASFTSNQLITDNPIGLHPNSQGYTAIMQALAQVMSPPLNGSNITTNQQAIANNQEQTIGLGWTTATQDASFYADSADWYAVYQVNIPAAGSNFFRLAGNDYEVTAYNETAQMAGVLDASTGQHFTSGVGSYAPTGLVVGDVLAFPSMTPTQYATSPTKNVFRIVNPIGNVGAYYLQWDPSNSASNICGSDDNLTPTTGTYTGWITSNISAFQNGVGGYQVGTVYRHKYAYSQAARAIAIATANSQYAKLLFANAYRFQLSSLVGGYNSNGLGWIIIQPVPGEFAANGKNLSAHTIVASDVLCLAGCEGGSLGGSLGLPLTSATITNPSTNQALTNVTAVTVANPGVFTTASAHGYSAGQAVQIGGTAAPGGFVNGLVYFVTATSLTTTTFTLASTPAGAAIQTTSAGTSVTVQAVPQASTIQLSGFDFTKAIVPQGILYSAT